MTEKFFIAIPSSLRYIPGLIDYINEVLGFFYDEDVCDSCTMGFLEIIENAVKHGNLEKIDLPVRISLACSEENLYAEVLDMGQGRSNFDEEKIPSPIQEENLLNTSGRGIFIAKSLFDDVDIEHSSEGTKVILKKNIAQ